MSKRFRTGLVVGKFAPLHLGHELLIRTATEQCERLYLISYSLPEMPGCGPEQRASWLAERFPEAISLVVTPDRVTAWQAQGKRLDSLPPNAAPAELHRHFVAQLCLEVLNDTVEAVFTSEAYGDGFAATLSACFARHGAKPVRHVQLDLARQAVPVSGTLIRADVHQARRFMAPAVYGDFVERICLLGGESSGKSVLSEALAQALASTYVAEYGRELWARRQGELVYGDMLAIAQEQLRRERLLAGQANRYLICDTSPLTTLFYSQHLFGRVAPRLQELAEHRYDLVLLCAPDFPFVQDGTRIGAAFRERQHQWYLAELARRSLPFQLLTGDIGERIEQVRALIESS